MRNLCRLSKKSLQFFDENGICSGDFAKNAANVIVDRTNEVRDRVFHKHETIRLSDFGEDKIDQHMNKSARSNSLGEINLEADSGSIKSL